MTKYILRLLFIVSLIISFSLSYMFTSWIVENFAKTRFTIMLTWMAVFPIVGLFLNAVIGMVKFLMYDVLDPKFVEENWPDLPHITNE